MHSTTRAQANAYANLMGYLPSSYQTDYFDWIERGHGNAVLNAVAGSGKTTVQVSAAKLLPRNVSALFLAFNKHIAETLTLKLAGTPMTARTVHSAGLALVTERLNSGASGGGRIQTETRKYRQVVKSLLWEYGRNMADDKRVELQKALEELTHLVRVTLTDPRDQAALDALMAQYSVVLDARLLERLYQLLPVALDEGERLATDGRLIDFDDMLWLPARWDLRPGQTVDWLLVDELQDLSRAQLGVALRLLPSDGGGRFCGVGDPQQSIMAFAGADNASFHNAQARTEALALPLSICYRCPTSHLALAREIVPQIEARPDAPEGTIGDLTIDKLPDEIRPGDMVICRLTAPLVAACIRLIQRRIPARVRGRDIGKQLTDILHAVERMPSYTWAAFGKWLDTYEQSQLERLSQREGAESAMESLSDRCQAVRVCYEQFQASDLDALCREIEALFDDGKPAVILSTVHRAKGLEAARVFILRPDKLPLVWPKQQPWEAEQEQHIRYVALTRATAALFWVWG